MDDVTRAELDRIHDEDARQNKRLDILENSVREIHDISLSVQKLAINMEHMLIELKDQHSKNDEQDGRIDAIEKAPLSTLKSAKSTAINTAIGICIGALITALATIAVNYL